MVVGGSSASTVDAPENTPDAMRTHARVSTILAIRSAEGLCVVGLIVNIVAVLLFFSRLT